MKIKKFTEGNFLEVDIDGVAQVHDDDPVELVIKPNVDSTHDENGNKQANPVSKSSLP